MHNSGLHQAVASLLVGPQPDSETESIKFDLYVKAAEIKQIADSLENVVLLPEKKRKQWLESHEELIKDLMESFMDDSMLAMDGMYLDPEASKLSVELVSNMRNAMN